MRLATVRIGSGVTWGVVADAGLVPADALGVAGRWPSLIDLIAAGRPALDDVRARAAGAMIGVAAIDRDRLRLLAPIPVPPQNPVAVGLNYREHARESAAATGVTEAPPHPMLFTKARTSIIGPDEAICIDERVTTKVDWEVELAVVVGRRARDLVLDNALDAVFGYTVANDVSARDLQFRDPKLPQFYQGKSLDTFCPLGPWIVTTDEFAPADREISLRVNGDVKQSGSTSQMIFGVADLLVEISRARTLEPGEIILTGTPAGVGFSRTPPEFLRPGDVVEAEIEGIGVLRNPVEGVVARS
jgi:2-keto-4-pentenoate hydratase/2-oxohepta-3-ene-1,7-dioic acid hydratase in catechol pathway